MWRGYRRVVVLLLLLVGLYWASRRASEGAEVGGPGAWLVSLFELLSEGVLGLKEWIARFQNWAPLVFLLVFVVWTVLVLPAWPLTLMAGVLFGTIGGTALVWVSATLAAAAAFLVGRYLVRDLVASWMGRRPLLRAVDRALAAEGWRVVLLLRLSPVVPYNVMNYALSVTSVDFWEYVLATWLGMLPGTLLYILAGDTVGDLASGNSRTMVLQVLGLVATVLATWMLARRANEILQKERARSGEGSTSRGEADASDL